MAQSKIAAEFYENVIKPELLAAAKCGQSSKQVDMSGYDLNDKISEIGLDASNEIYRSLKERIISRAKADCLAVDELMTRPEVLVFNWHN